MSTPNSENALQIAYQFYVTALAEAKMNHTPYIQTYEDTLHTVLLQIQNSDLIKMRSQIASSTKEELDISYRFYLVQLAKAGNDEVLKQKYCETLFNIQRQIAEIEAQEIMNAINMVSTKSDNQETEAYFEEISRATK